MAYQELVKHFDRIRDYMRDFFIFGFKSRNDFHVKSARTYDNERRRIENYLGDQIRWEYNGNGKAVYISINSASIPHNPLYHAYKARSFTDNDIILHFLLLDSLEDCPHLSAEQAADHISREYHLVFDTQTVRNKLNEYSTQGLLCKEKQGRSYIYSKSPFTYGMLASTGRYFGEMLHFFSETAPFSVAGSFLLDYEADSADDIFSFKHHFLSHTLEDNILLALIQAMENQCLVELTNFHSKSQRNSVSRGYPLKIHVSTQTGRRYLMLYREGSHKITPQRIDYIKKVKALEKCPNAEKYRKQYTERQPYNFSLSPGAGDTPEYFAMTLRIDECREQYLLNRLEREGKGGIIEKTGCNTYRYSIYIFDTNEIMRWVKTFTGRIVKVEGDNQPVIQKFYRDMRRMAKRYGVD